MIDFATAAARFGLGVRPGDARAGDVRRGLLAQFDRFDPRPSEIAGAPQRAAVVGNLADYLERTRALRAQNMGSGTGKPGDDPMLKDALKDTRRYAAETARGEYLALVGARANAALVTPAPFVERMVHFWANHFAISTDKLVTIGLGGLLEFDAVRPHVLGRFVDMLLAVETHPAMLMYLDQAQSTGPDSRIGAIVAARGRRKIGLNENLVREIMELHTLGVRTGYTQADVTELARAMTGWTVAGIARGPVQRMTALADKAPGQFVFADAMHQPGPRMVMGRQYAAGGVEQARAVLTDLAASPATARHIATKLVRHFAGDVAVPALVDRLASSFAATGGALPALYRILIDAPELAAPSVARFRTPWDWTVAALRAVGTSHVEGQAVAGLLNQLGQPVWRPGSPAGWDDSDVAWAGPDALLRRVEAASRIATRAGGSGADPRALAAAVLPAGGSPATLAAIARAESPVEGIALTLVSPEFLRR